MDKSKIREQTCRYVWYR